MCKDVPPEDTRYVPVMSWKEYIGIYECILLAIIVFLMYFVFKDQGPYYLGCADRHGSELVLQTDKKPRVDGSIVYIGDDVFVVPEPGMTCRIVTVKKLNEEKASKKVDNPI